MFLFLLLFPSHALRACLLGHSTGEVGQKWWRLWVHQGRMVPALHDPSSQLSQAEPGMVTEVSHRPPPGTSSGPGPSWEGTPGSGQEGSKEVLGSLGTRARPKLAAAPVAGTMQEGLGGGWE